MNQKEVLEYKPQTRPEVQSVREERVVHPHVPRIRKDADNGVQTVLNTYACMTFPRPGWVRETPATAKDDSSTDK